MSMKKYEEWDANHKHDNPPREKIVKLGRKITDVADHIFGGVKVCVSYVRLKQIKKKHFKNY